MLNKQGTLTPFLFAFRTLALPKFLLFGLTRLLWNCWGIRLGIC
jgi:hypothetical protein